MAIKKSHKSQVTSHKLRNKRILITAGPTWVPIDDVRVISNIATGETGILLAKEAKRFGAKVTLFLGPGNDYCFGKGVNIVRFRYFDEFRNKIRNELRKNKYDYIIHSAAVSDFKPQDFLKGKISSKGAIKLRLKPLPKIYVDIRRLASEAKLVIFKLESGISDDTLIRRAKLQQYKAGAGLVVANSLNPYRAFVINRGGDIISAKSKKELVKKLFKFIK
ncbi:MAG: phosphopantothenoylcysteine decarboxylase [Candidatus Omnitrophota bacterium]